MALGASIYKVNLNLSNLNTHQYGDFNLTMAKHPSENESRMMFRLLAFAYCADEKLEFTKGLSDVDEPELWMKSYGGDILQWIELGLPEAKRIKQALGKSLNVKIFAYHPNKTQEWFDKIKEPFENNEKLEVYAFNVEENGPLDVLVSKTMNLNCLIQDGMMYLSNDSDRVGVSIRKL
ncbi:MAG: hypothetical protein COW00_06995 [Bdellovibrio sp. CG12_big_fil_rev_8_21_14_0_65_39_13]|nr:MAG: hypothetical protein COW78_03120 [Bdellovibrio sp. CG22_combo_CG10-13_8_21_14_all_39_27]PIQ60350.1 MAG: hypothetical protein COW00_06995 [Bdellovibrio sp. CG12_big_fil_rev_8_21_14_0_65_39_13]PIR35041.1 MAG: hypothetical protein COV37_10465 [Bdellovibrio sp. CG11_big_fil_rev_8_21_14_0_20_39_38]